MKKTVLITGASAGFGAACARKYAGVQTRLILAARRLGKLTALQQELGNTECHLLQLDVRSRDGVAAAFRSLPASFREVDILINNAGLALGLEPAHEADLDKWENMVDTNIKGLMFCTRQILPGMVQRRGAISSISGRWRDPPPIPAVMSTARPRPLSSSSQIISGLICWAHRSG